MISQETQLLFDFDLDTDGNVELSFNNVQRAETIMEIYNKKSIENIRSALIQLRNNYTYENLKNACTIINRENNTHLRNTDKEAICRRIIRDYPSYTMYENALTSDDHPLIGLIRYRNDIQFETIRDNYSFATKFCHFSCYFLLETDNDRDRYPIYDSVMKKYIKDVHYVRDDQMESYNNYISTIDNIINNRNISRNGFDHLIWIYYR